MKTKVVLTVPVDADLLLVRGPLNEVIVKVTGDIPVRMMREEKDQ